MQVGPFPWVLITALELLLSYPGVKEVEKSLQVIIVDDDALIRDSLKMLLDLEEDFQVLGLAGNGQEALELCQRELPDLVLMDIRMPIMDCWAPSE